MPLYFDIDSTEVVSYKVFLYVVAAITFVVTPVFIYTVIYKSSKLMNSYRVLVLAYLPFSVLTTITITLLIPIFDDPTNPSNGYHFYGELFNLQSSEAVLNLVSQLVIYVFDMVITDLLLIMLIDRYGIVSKTVTTRPNWVFPFCYATITISNIFAMVIIIANIVLFVFYPNEPLSDQFIVIEMLLIPAAAFYQLSRIAGFITVIWLNVNFKKKHASTASATVNRLHKMLTRSVIVNILCTAFFTVPCSEVCVYAFLVITFFKLKLLG